MPGVTGFPACAGNDRLVFVAHCVTLDAGLGAGPIPPRAHRRDGADASSLTRYREIRPAIAALPIPPVIFPKKETAHAVTQIHSPGPSRGRREVQELGQMGPDDEIGTLNYTRPEDIIA